MAVDNKLTFDPPTRVPELTQNLVRSSHGHSTSCKSVQPFSRNVADKERKKERHRSKTIPRPFTGGGVMINYSRRRWLWATFACISYVSAVYICASWRHYRCPRQRTSCRSRLETRRSVLYLASSSSWVRTMNRSARRCPRRRSSKCTLSTPSESQWVPSFHVMMAMAFTSSAKERQKSFWRSKYSPSAVVYV